MKRIDFEPFFENSSSTEILIDFGNGGSFAQLKRDCVDHYDERLLLIVKQLGKRKVKQSRRLVNSHLQRQFQSFMRSGTVL